MGNAQVYKKGSLMGKVWHQNIVRKEGCFLLHHYIRKWGMGGKSQINDNREISKEAL